MTKVLAINCGSSTLKFDLIDISSKNVLLGNDRRIANGIIDRIGGLGAIAFRTESGDSLRKEVSVAEHGVATHLVLSWLESQGLMEPDGLEAIGHRVVHGGAVLVEPAFIEDDVIESIEAVSELAPLHNEPALIAIRVARSALGSRVPMVATFDTAFHHTMPACARRYAIPEELATRHRIRRYGFHGIAHRYMTERYAAIVATPIEQIRIVTLQLGNGCSATAVQGGYSVDTSMGLTPLEGLIMGTRSGDVDPSLAGFIARREGVSVSDVEGWFNTRSGLLGVSARSHDMRELLAAERQGDAQASLAVEMFCYRVRKCIGAYLAVLGGADAVVFGGGIGENSPVVRARICAGMSWCGLTLDQKRNEATIGAEERVSADHAQVKVYVIPVDEAAIIARDTVRCLLQRGEG